MGATLANSTAILKEVYESGVEEQLNNEVIALKRIERTSEGVTSDIGGKYVVFATHTRRNGGIGARLENKTESFGSNCADDSFKPSSVMKRLP